MREINCQKCIAFKPCIHVCRNINQDRVMYIHQYLPKYRQFQTLPPYTNSSFSYVASSMVNRSIYLILGVTNRRILLVDISWSYSILINALLCGFSRYLWFWRSDLMLYLANGHSLSWTITCGQTGNIVSIVMIGGRFEWFIFQIWSSFLLIYM